MKAAQPVTSPRRRSPQQASLAATLIPFHSFLLLSIAISIGPIQTKLVTRQWAFAVLLAITGFCLSIVQTVLAFHRSRRTDNENRIDMDRTVSLMLAAFWIAVGLWISYSA